MGLLPQSLVQIDHVVVFRILVVRKRILSVVLQYVCPLWHEGIDHIGHLLPGCLAQPDSWHTSYATPQFIQLIGRYKTILACVCLSAFVQTYRFVGLRCDFESLERIAVGCWIESDFSDRFSSEWRGGRIFLYFGRR